MAEFKTAYLQRAVPVDVNVVGTVNEGVTVTSSNRKAAILRNDFVIYTPATGTVNGYIKKATQAQVDAKQATHIVALSDMTIGDGHVATELKNYASSELVGAQMSTAPENKSTPTKKVALYPIWDYSDIVQDIDKMDAGE